MKSRNKEVNIFNMSLLDILCGALGAFCFMMLSLFPDHAKVKDLQAQVDELKKNSSTNAQQRIEQAEKERDKARAEQTLAYFMVSWNAPADVDLWIVGGSGRMWAPKKDLVPPDKLGGSTRDTLKGPGNEIVWFSDVAYSGSVYRMFAKLQAVNGSTLPVAAHGYIVGRVRVDSEHSSMGLNDLGAVQLTEAGAFVEIGRIGFKDDDFDVYMGAMTTGPAGAPHFLGRTELPRLLAMPPLDPGGGIRH